MKMFRNPVPLALVALMLASCGSGGDDASTTDTAQGQDQLAKTEMPVQDPSTDQPVAETLVAKDPIPPAAKKVEKKSAPKKVEPPPPPAPVMVSIPAATSLVVSLNTRLRTDSNLVGDQFSATLIEPLMIDGQVAIAAGTMINGHLSKVEEPHRTSGRAQLTLQFDKLATADGPQSIAAVPIELLADPDKVSDEAKVAAGGVVGGIIGAIASKKKGKGAAVGAAVGAAAGGAIAVATKGKQLELTVGQQLSVQLAEAVEVTAVEAK